MLAAACRNYCDWKYCRPLIQQLSLPCRFWHSGHRFADITGTAVLLVMHHLLDLYHLVLELLLVGLQVTLMLLWGRPWLISQLVALTLPASVQLAQVDTSLMEVGSVAILLQWLLVPSLQYNLPCHQLILSNLLAWVPCLGSPATQCHSFCPKLHL